MRIGVRYGSAVIFVHMERKDEYHHQHLYENFGDIEMKTLDEVIIGIKEQMGLGDPILIDALHYLKEYQGYLLGKEISDAFDEAFSEMDNPPLTWDELKQMEGKAVWIEGMHHKHWCIIKGIARKDLSEMEYITLAYLNNKNRIVTYDRRKGNFDVTWQAYRKEKYE